MPLGIIRNDITKMKVDAIVNAANESLLGGGGVDGAIHQAAGPGLLEECRTLGGCKTGSAKITKGYDLPAKYVIHTPGPVWHGGLFGEKRKLESCYRSCLELARQHRCETVAFPLISAGAYGYPKGKALRVAVDTISDFLSEHDMTVYLVLFSQSAFQTGSQLFQDIQSYIDDRYAALREDPSVFRFRRMQQALDADIFCGSAKAPAEDLPEKSFSCSPQPSMSTPRSQPSFSPQKSRPMSLEELLGQIDESFSEMLLRKIDEKGIKDSDCYKKANISRKLFSKIRSDRLYKPSKPTVLAFAIALELSLEETRDMLQKAGFALSHASKFDIIVEYFILNETYDIYTINEALFAFDQSLLGA